MTLPLADLARDRLLARTWDDLGRPRCWVTGGYVRDRLLGRPSQDLDLVLEGDIAASGGPARRLARAMGTRAHVFGREPRAVWRIENGSSKVELWPLGELSLEADARRRDFGCNALLWALPAGPLVDVVGGAEDLERRRLRAVSRANLQADPVRLLRVCRFAAQLPELELDAATMRWTAELAASLAAAPRERCGVELLLLVTAPAAARGLRLLHELHLQEPAGPPGVPAAAAPDPDLLAAAPLLAAPVRHPLRGVRRAAGKAAPLGLLLALWRAPEPATLAPYAWPRELRESAVRAAGLLPRALATVHAPSAHRRALVHEAGRAFPALLALASAVDLARGGAPEPWRRWARLWRERGEELMAPPPLLASEEVAARAGVEPGPELGRLLQQLRRAQVRGEVRTPAGARRLLDRLTAGS